MIDLMPSEQFFRCTMERTSYISSDVLWREQVIFLQMYYGENKLHFFRSTMERTSYISSDVLWREQVTFLQ